MLRTLNNAEKYFLIFRVVYDEKATTRTIHARPVTKKATTRTIHASFDPGIECLSPLSHIELQASYTERKPI